MFSSSSSGLLSCLPQRYVITLLGVLLTVIASTMKYSIGIVLTEMVAPSEMTRFVNFTIDPEACPYTAPPPVDDIHIHKAGLLVWSERTQGLVVGALYWTYTPLQLPAGLWAERAGPRVMLGGGMLLASLGYLFSPLAVDLLGATGLIIARTLVGTGLATVYPSLNVLLARWAPPSEKGRLGAIIYAGENVGIVFSLAASGLVLGSARGQWALLFYLYGALGLAWLGLWTCLGYDHPNSHPFITAAEKLYLERCLAQSCPEKKLAPTPWRSMVRSAPLWGTMVAQLGHDWGLITLVTQLPRYMKDILHYEIQTNGLLTAIPYVAMTLVAVVSGWLSDRILSYNRLSITSVRKLFTSIAAVGPALGVVAAMNAGCNRVLVITMVTVGTALMGCFYPSLGVNTLDLSPNYCGSLMGIIAYGGLAGIASPYLTALLAPQGTMLQWRSVFWVAVCVLVASNSFFLAVGSGEEQPWNVPEVEGQTADTKKQTLDERRQEDGTV